jgi:hypothetical protein
LLSKIPAHRDNEIEAEQRNEKEKEEKEQTNGLRCSKKRRG